MGKHSKYNVDCKELKAVQKSVNLISATFYKTCNGGMAPLPTVTHCDTSQRVSDKLR